MKHFAFAPYDENIKNESLLPENALILINSPEILRCKRSHASRRSRHNEMESDAVERKMDREAFIAVQIAVCGGMSESYLMKTDFSVFMK